MSLSFFSARSIAELISLDIEKESKPVMVFPKILFVTFLVYL